MEPWVKVKRSIPATTAAFLGDTLLCDEIRGNSHVLVTINARTGEQKAEHVLPPIDAIYYVYARRERDEWVVLLQDGKVKILDRDLKEKIEFQIEPAVFTSEMTIFKNQDIAVVASGYFPGKPRLVFLGDQEGHPSVAFPECKDVYSRSHVCGGRKFFFPDERTGTKIIAVDIESGDCEEFCKIGGHGFFSAIQSIGGRILAIGTSKGHVILWKMEEHTLIGFAKEKFESEIESIYDLDDGLHIVVACREDKRLRVVNISTLETVADLNSDMTRQTQNAFSPGGRYAALHSGDKTFDLVETNFPFIVHETATLVLASYGQVFSKPVAPEVHGKLVAATLEKASEIVLGSPVEKDEWATAIRAIKEDSSLRWSLRSTNKYQLLARSKFSLMQQASILARKKFKGNSTLYPEMFQIIGSYLKAEHQ